MATSDFNVQLANIEPIVLTDTSGTTIYTGISINGNTGSAAIWKIKKTWLDGTVMQMGFPDGDQNFSYVWNNRTSYTYQ